MTHAISTNNSLISVYTGETVNYTPADRFLQDTPDDDIAQGTVRNDNGKLIRYDRYYGWMPVEETTISIGPGPELTEMWTWYLGKIADEAAEEELLLNHPELKEYKDRYEFMKKMLADEKD